MANNSLWVNPLTGGYEVIDNILAHVHPSIVKANALLCQQVNGYIYNLQAGNPLINNNKNFTQADIINAINITLTPLVNSNDLLGFKIINIVASTVIRNRYTIYIQFLLPNGTNPITDWKIN